MKKFIYIYNGAGTGKESLTHTRKTFSDFPVRLINAHKISLSKWTEDAALLIMPGGADVPYVKKLSGRNNSIIKEYVSKGGNYLGICAGAYYASSYIEFDKGGPLEVLGSRDLAFFPGMSIGPVLARYDCKSYSGARAAYITYGKDNLAIYYNGGGYFKDVENFPNIKILATYNNGMPAMIETNYNKGKVILSAVHFEYNPSLLNHKDSYLREIIPTLEKHNNDRYKIILDIIQRLRL